MTKRRWEWDGEQLKPSSNEHGYDYPDPGEELMAVSDVQETIKELEERADNRPSSTIGYGEAKGLRDAATLLRKEVAE